MPTEFNIKTSDNINLSCRHYPVKNASAVILIVHGLGEYQDRYKHVAAAFNDAGSSCLSFDIRGHGYSEGKRGYIPSYDQLMDDMDMVVDHTLKIEDGQPLVLYGHSMGGNIVANYLLRKKRTEIYAAILSSPWLKLAMDPTILEIGIGKLLSKLWPGFTRNTNLKPHLLSHDKKVVSDYIEDPKVHSRITPNLFFGHRAAGQWALEHAHENTVPLLVMQSEKDHIVSPGGAKEFADKAGAEFKLWEGMYHEPHNEIHKQKVLDYMVEWISTKIRASA